MQATSLHTQLVSVWVLTTSLLVYVMHGGFGFFEAGMTRRKSTVTTLTHNLMVLALTVVVFWICGFAFMFGDGPGWIGLHGFCPSFHQDPGPFRIPHSSTIPIAVFFAFTLSYADTPATLVAGTCAERLKLSGFMIITAITGAILLPLVGRWTIGAGFLANLRTPVYDTGSGFLQLTGGVLALCTVVVLGPRAGRFGPRGKINAVPSSSMPLVFLGAFILWMGFLGFNAGFALSTDRSIGLVLTNTVLGSMFGACVALVGVWLLRGKGSLRAALVGMLTACVAATSPAAVVEPWAAAVTGAVAGAVTPLCISLWTHLRIDDATDYLTMNVVGGLIGQLAVGLLASPDIVREYTHEHIGAGLFYGGGEQLLSQAIGVGVAIGATAIPGLALALALRAAGLLRIDPKEEKEGSDKVVHGELAYPGFAWDKRGDIQPQHHQP